MRHLISLILIISAPPVLACADLASMTPKLPKMSAQYESCTNIGRKLTDNEYRECLRPELALRERELDQQFSKTLKKLNKSRQNKLQLKQQKWSLDRKKACEEFVSATIDTGIHYASAYDYCYLNKTVRRTEWLAKYR